MTIHFFFDIVSSFNIMKALTLLVHAGLFWCFYNPQNSDMDFKGSLTCVCDLRYMRIHTGRCVWWGGGRRGRGEGGKPRLIVSHPMDYSRV